MSIRSLLAGAALSLLVAVPAVAWPDEVRSWDLPTQYPRVYIKWKTQVAKLGIKEKWLTDLAGTSGVVTDITVAGMPWKYVTSCEPGACANIAVLLFTPISERLVGIVVDNGTVFAPVGDKPTLTEQSCAEHILKMDGNITSC